MYQVIKRDGKITEFDLKKITRAIEKAFISLKKEYHPSVIDMLALKVTSDFEKKIKTICSFNKAKCEIEKERILSLDKTNC